MNESAQDGVASGSSVNASNGCPICGHADRCLLHTVNSFTIARCRLCTNRYVVNPPAPEALASLYGEEFFAGYHGRDYTESTAERRSEIERRLRTVQRLCGPGANRRLLDVGCAHGFFVAAARDAGWAAEGIDVSEHAIRFAREQLGLLSVHQGDLRQRTDWRGSFSTVTLWATVEHLSDPVAVLRTIRDLLVPGGYLILDTGLVGDFVDHLGEGLSPWYASPPEHLFFFTRKGLGTALRGAGLSSVKTHLDRDVSWPRLLAHRLRKLAAMSTLWAWRRVRGAPRSQFARDATVVVGVGRRPFPATDSSARFQE